MNTNWSKILLFSLLSLALGVVIGHMWTYNCMRGCDHHGGCEMSAGCDHGGAMHHGEGKASCCAGGGHEHGEGHGHDDHGVHAIVHQLEEANFQGDTTITIDGGTVNVKRDGDKTEVHVEVRDSTGKKVTVELEETH